MVNQRKKLKIALLISGQARFLRGEGYRSIKEKLLDVYDCDVFCHVWWDPEGGQYITAPWSGLGNMDIPKNVDKDIEELYSPKKMKWDKPLDPDKNMKKYERIYNVSTLYNLLSMYLSMKRSYELMNEYINNTHRTEGREVKYDWVIRLRYDAILTNFPDLNSLNKKAIYAPDYSQFHNKIGNNTLIMHPKYVHVIMRIYDHMDITYNTPSGGVVFNDEEMITARINMTKTPVVILDKKIFYVDLCRKL